MPDTTTGENVNSIELLGNNLQFTSITASTDAFNDYLLYASINRMTSVTSLVFMENYNNVAKIYKNLIKD